MSIEGSSTVWWVNQYAVVPSGSGGTRHFDMTKALRRSGWDTVIVASDLNLHTRSYERRRGPWDLRAISERIGGVPFHWLPAGSYRTNDWRRATSMAAFGASVLVFLLRRVRRRDVVIGSSPHLFGAFAAWLASRVRRCPFVFEVRDLWPESFTAVSGKERGIEIRLMRRMSDVLYRSADAVVVLAEGSRSVVVERGGAPERVVWIPNGVDTSTFEPRSAARAPEDPVRFVYTGAHGPANGLDTVIDAAALVHRRGRDDIEVVLVGDGSVKDALVARARSLGAPVRFEDPLPKSAVPGVLAGCDVGLMVLADVDLFTFGVSPNKLFDYLAAGLPVLTNVPGFVRDVVDDSGAGLFVSPGDAEALAAGMESMTDELRSGAGSYRDGRSYVEARFERRKLAGVLAELLESVRHDGASVARPGGDQHRG